MNAPADTEPATSFDELTPAAQIAALKAQITELRSEKNELLLRIDAQDSERADIAEVQRRYEALRGSTLGRVTTRYWEMRRRFAGRG